MIKAGSLAHVNAPTCNMREEQGEGQTDVPSAHVLLTQGPA